MQFSVTQRELAPEYHQMHAQVVAIMDNQKSRDEDLGPTELHTLARFVEVAQIVGLVDSAAFYWAQIQLGDAQHTAALAALGQHDPRKTAINTRGWWSSWQEQWNSEGLPPLA